MYLSWWKRYKQKDSLEQIAPILLYRIGMYYRREDVLQIYYPLFGVVEDYEEKRSIC
ncbi:MAG: hypothetical protein R6V50_07680 [Thermoplasmatota archaeon]